jgi:heme-degrading monooxygenase HmoA
MFASIRRYRLESGSMDDLLHLIDTDFAESISQADGFVAYEVLECGADELVTMSVFRDSDAAEASDEMAMEWIRSAVSPHYEITRTDVIHGEVVVSRAMSEMLEPAHH